MGPSDWSRVITWPGFWLLISKESAMGVCLSQTRCHEGSPPGRKYKWTNQNFFSISEHCSKVSRWHVSRVLGHSMFSVSINNWSSPPLLLITCTLHHSRTAATESTDKIKMIPANVLRHSIFASQSNFSPKPNFYWTIIWMPQILFITRNLACGVNVTLHNNN